MSQQGLCFTRSFLQGRDRFTLRKFNPLEAGFFKRERTVLEKSRDREGKDYTRRLEMHGKLLHSAMKDMVSFTPSKPAHLRLIGEFDVRVVNSFSQRMGQEYSLLEGGQRQASEGGLPKRLTRHQVLSLRERSGQRSKSSCHQRLYVSAEQEEEDVDLHKLVQKSNEHVKLPVLPPYKLKNLKMNRKR
jgi:hypothetical protein